MGKGKYFGFSGLQVLGALLILALLTGVISFANGTVNFDGDKIPFIGADAQAQSVAGSTSTTTTASGTSCVLPTGGNTATKGVIVRNSQNNTYQQLAGTVWLSNNAGAKQSSVTATDGAAAAYASMTPIPCVEGYFYVLGDSNVNGAKVQGDTLTPFGNVDIITSRASRFTGSFYTTSFGDDNASAEAQGSALLNTTTHAISSGGSYSGYLDLNLQQASAAAGSKDGGVIIGIDHNQAVYSLSNGVKLSSQTAGVTLESVSCAAYPDVVAVDNVDSCYKMGQVSTSTPTPIRVAFTVKADLGEPGASDDVIIYVNDVQHHLDNDVFKLSAYDSGSNDEGATKNIFRIDVS